MQSVYVSDHPNLGGNVLNELAKKIRSQREKLGLKQQDVANALRLSPQAVSKWERGENAPDITVLAQLAHLLGVSTDWLLTTKEVHPDVFPATVLVSSVRGAYQKSQRMAPRDFATWGNGLFFTLTEITLRFGAVPIKYMGDRYLCFFSGANHEARALESGLSAMRTIAENLKLGLSSGEIYLGAMGHPDYAKPDIMGEVVNIAFLTLDWAEKTKSGIAATQPVLTAGNRTAVRTEELEVDGQKMPVTVCEVGHGRRSEERAERTWETVKED